MTAATMNMNISPAFEEDHHTYDVIATTTSILDDNIPEPVVETIKQEHEHEHFPADTEKIGLLNAEKEERHVHFKLEPTMNVCEESNNGSNNETSSSTQHSPRALVAASATAGGLVGCLIGGIICATISVVATTYAVTRENDSCVGDVARSLGEVVLVAGDKAAEVEKKHELLQHTKTTLTQTTEMVRTKTKELEAQYQIAEKSKRMVVETGQTAYQKGHAAYNYSVNHPLVQRGMMQVKQGYEYVRTKVGAVQAVTTSSAGVDNSIGVDAEVPSRYCHYIR